MTTNFDCKQFSVQQEKSAMKIGTDSILLGSWATGTNPSMVLDIGTGTGILALMMAQKFSGSKTMAVEIDENPFEEAKLNFKNSPWSDRIEAVHSSIQDFAKTSDDLYDLIICNPPFFSGGTLSENSERATVRHTVKLAHGDLLRTTRSLLSKEGVFCLITPLIEGLRFEEMAKTYNYNLREKVEVSSFRDQPAERLLLKFSKSECQEPQSSKLHIYEKVGEYSDEYKDLTKDYYL